MKKCPYCAEEIQDEAIFCRYCQHDLTKTKSQKQSGTTQRLANRKRLLATVIVVILFLLFGLAYLTSSSKRPFSNLLTNTPVPTFLPEVASTATIQPTPTTTPTPKPTQVPLLRLTITQEASPYTVVKGVRVPPMGCAMSYMNDKQADFSTKTIVEKYAFSSEIVNRFFGGFKVDNSGPTMFFNDTPIAPSVPHVAWEFYSVSPNTQLEDVQAYYDKKLENVFLGGSQVFNANSDVVTLVYLSERSGFLFVQFIKNGEDWPMVLVLDPYYGDTYSPFPGKPFMENPP